jgi:DNA-directed RNA polymerase subunit RPC12/RpoP
VWVQQIMAKHPQYRVILLASVLVIVAWLFLAGLLVSMTCGMLNCSTTAKPFFIYSSISLIIICLITLPIASIVRCSRCGGKMLKQSYKQKHQYAARYPLLDYWSSAVIDCLRKRRITCMYCGTQFDLKERQNIE